MISVRPTRDNLKEIISISIENGFDTVAIYTTTYRKNLSLFDELNFEFISTRVNTTYLKIPIASKPTDIKPFPDEIFMNKIKKIKHQFISRIINNRIKKYKE